MNIQNYTNALIYMRAGVALFPCREAGANAKSPYTRNGYKQATTDLPTFDKWTMRYPNAIWGLPPARHNALVIDADQHGKGDGVATMAALFDQHGFDLRSIPVVQTPNNGRHYIFRRPAGLGSCKGQIAPAVDVKNNGYIIAPGMSLPDGRCYALVEGSVEHLAHAIATASLPVPPEWLLGILAKPHVEPKPYQAPTNDAALLNQIKGVINAVLRADEGSRNSVLHWAACRMGEMVAAGSISFDDALSLLNRAGAHIGLGVKETDATALSGLLKTCGEKRDAC